ncbi:hypothetical protein PENTCL1PPCAC_21571, partial [Pristionchus entomophagus]
KALHVSFVYIVLAIICSVKLAAFIWIFVNGEPVNSTLLCTRFYNVKGALSFTMLSWAFTLFIAPILTTIMIIKGLVKREPISGVSGFILTSSLTLATHIISYIILSIGFDPYASLPFHGEIVLFFHNLSYVIQNFRLLFLCLFASLIVSDIRGALLSVLGPLFSCIRLAISNAVRKLFGRQAAPSNIANEVF